MRREVEREANSDTTTPEISRIRKERAKAIVQRMLAAQKDPDRE
jgi:hypothetical protein